MSRAAYLPPRTNTAATLPNLWLTKRGKQALLWPEHRVYPTSITCPARYALKRASYSTAEQKGTTMNRLFDKSAPQNVHGWERSASVAGGLVMLGRGLRRGGLSGLLQLAIGGMALARGISGRCEAKRILTASETQPRQVTADKQRYSHMPLDSEVHSPDFAEPDVNLPDATPMGHETHPGERRGT